MGKPRRDDGATFSFFTKKRFVLEKNTEKFGR